MVIDRRMSDGTMHESLTLCVFLNLLDEQYANWGRSSILLCFLGQSNLISRQIFMNMPVHLKKQPELILSRILYVPNIKSKQTRITGVETIKIGSYVLPTSPVPCTAKRKMINGRCRAACMYEAEEFMSNLSTPRYSKGYLSPHEELYTAKI